MSIVMSAKLAKMGMGLLGFLLLHVRCNGSSDIPPDANDRDASTPDSFVRMDGKIFPDGPRNPDLSADISDRGTFRPPSLFLVSTTPEGEPGDASSLACSVTSTPEGAMGPVVFFLTGATRMVAGEPIPTRQLYARNFERGDEEAVNELVSVSSDGTSPATGEIGHAESPIDSTSDGRSVYYEALSPDLVPGVDDTYWQVYSRDRETRTNGLVSQTAEGTPGDGDSGAVSTSYNGDAQAFHTIAPIFSAGFPPTFGNAVLKNQITGATLLVGRESEPYLAISGNGRFIAWRESEFIPSGGMHVFDRETDDDRTLLLTGRPHDFNGDGSLLSFSYGGWTAVINSARKGMSRLMAAPPKYAKT